MLLDPGQAPGQLCAWGMVLHAPRLGEDTGELP